MLCKNEEKKKEAEVKTDTKNAKTVEQKAEIDEVTHCPISKKEG